MKDDRLCALSVASKNVLLLFKTHASRMPNTVPGGIIPPHDAEGETHIAFAISRASLPECEETLQKLDIAVESRVFPERGRERLYFRDPDRHLGELAIPGVWSIY